MHLLAQMTGPFVVRNGAVSGSDVTLKSSGVPTPTAVGRVEWGTTNNALYVGNGASASVIWNGLQPGGLWGCETGNNGADPTNDIDFTTGTVVSSDALSRANCVALTKQLDTTWVAGTGQGMRSSAAALANGTWHLFAVWPAGGTVDYFATTSASAATALAQLQAMPGGATYTFARRLGSIVRATGAIRAYRQYADRFIWDVPASDVSTSNPGTFAVTATLTVPTGLVVSAITNFAVDASSAVSNLGFGLLTALVQTDTAPSSTVWTLRYTDIGGGDIFAANVVTETATNTSGQIRYRISQSAGAISANIETIGWIDTRGRLN
jgi:hypothetical protein